MLMRERFERAVQEGDLPEGTECTTLARFVVMVVNGLAVQAADASYAPDPRNRWVHG
jgi:hypothetical protein